MGIDLGDVLVRRPATLNQYAGKRLAFDAWNVLYQFLASIRGPDGTPLMDREGHVTSHLVGILTRTGALVEAGIRPVFVFDGPPHPLKAATLAERALRKERAGRELADATASAKTAGEAAAAATTDEEREAALQAQRGHLESARTKASQTSRLTLPMVAESQELLRALGVPFLEAPGEGEAQAAWMASQGIVDAAVSQDFDAILFGTPVLVRNLSVGGRRKLPGKQAWVEVGPEEVPLAESLAGLGLTREQLVDAALLVGTDFHAGVKGIGAKKAVTLIARDGSLEALLSRLAATPATSAVERAIQSQLDGLTDRAEVRRIFLEPAHTRPTADLGLRPPDGEAVRRLLVERHGFQAERVEAGLARFAAARGKRGQSTLF